MTAGMTRLAMPLSLYATEPAATVGPDAPLPEVHRLLLARGVSSLCVVDGEGRGLGVVSRTDLLRLGRVRSKRASGHAVLVDLPEQPVREVMTHGVLTVSADTPVSGAARTMVERRIHRVFVEREGRITGVFSTKDVLAALRDERSKAPLSEHMSKPAFTIGASEPLSLATDRLGKAHVTGLVVIDDDEWPIGTFTQLEALEARELPADTPVEVAMSHAMLCLHVSTPLFRAAAQALDTRARRVLAVDDRRVKGVMTGLDFARAAS